jgi:enamine deaminase RidA (YjgF/YER057c/UK114 family)
MKSWCAALLGLSLVGCAGGSRINHFDHGSYSGSVAIAAAPDGEMDLAVYGSPLPAGSTGLAEAVANGLNGTHVDHRTKFIPTQHPDLTGYRTVVVFGPSTPKTVCQTTSNEGLATGSPAPMTAAFCYGDEVLSYVSGQVPELAGPDDPTLKAQMQITGFTLFPPENPHYASDCQADVPICRD